MRTMKRPRDGRRVGPLTLALLMTLMIFASAPALAQDEEKGGEESADQIIDRMLERNDAFGVDAGQAKLRLLVEDRTGDRRARELTVRSKKFGAGARTRVELTAPKELKGQAFLFAQNDGGEDDVWMYLPAFGVTRRVEGSQKRGAFLGTHFTFADLESRDIAQGSYERLEDDEIAGQPVWVIAATPKDASSSSYGKVVSYVRKSDDMPLKFRFYDKDGETELKTIFVEKIAKADDGEPYIKQMTMRSKKGGFTTIVLDAVEETAELPDALFSREQLGK